MENISLNGNSFLHTLSERLHIVYAVVALLFGVAFILVTPPGVNLDECNHFARVESILNGDIIARDLSNGQSNDQFGGEVNNIDMSACQNGNDLVGKNIDFINNRGDNARINFPYWTNSSLDLNDEEGPLIDVPFSNTAIYNPILYTPFLAGEFFGKIFTKTSTGLIIWMRLFGLLTFVVGMFFIIKKLPETRWLFFGMGIIPISIISASSITADTVSTLSCYFLIAYVLHISNSPDSKKTTIPLLVLSLLIACSKPVYILLLFFPLLLPLTNPLWRTKRLIVKICGILAISLVCFFVWYNIIHGINTGTFQKPGENIDPGGQLNFIFDNPSAFASVVLKNLPLAFVFLSWIFFLQPNFVIFYIYVIATLISMIFLFFATDQVSSDKGKKSRISKSVACIALFLAVFIMVYLALYLQYNEVGSSSIDGIQGRYFLPVLPLLYVGISGLIMGWREGSGNMGAQRLSLQKFSRIAFVVLSISIMIFVTGTGFMRVIY